MRRAMLALLVVVALLAGGLALGVGPVLNSDAVRARVVAAAERATGHAVRIGGRFQVAGGSVLALAPVISVEDVAVLNGPGYSRDALVSARRVEAVVSLLRLLRGRAEVRSVTVDGADALLERDGSGRGNWLPAAAPAAAGQGSAPRARTPVQVGPVRIESGRVAWLGLPAVEVRSLTVLPAGGPVSGTVVVNGAALALGGEVNAGESSFAVTATGGGLALAAARQQGGPWNFQGSAADLGTVSALAGRVLPPLRDVQFEGQTVAAEAGPAIKVSGRATFKALAMTFTAGAGPWNGPGGPVWLQVTADGGKVAAEGTLDRAARAFEGTVSADVADLGRTGALAGVALPRLQAASLAARVLPASGGGGFLFRGLRLASAQGDVAGDVALTFAPRPALRGSLVGQQWNLDTWSMETPVKAPEPVADHAPSAVPSGASPWVIPDRPLPFDALRRADGDLRVSVGQATLRGAAYRAVTARIALQDGRLRVDPVGMVSPGGAVQGRFSADATTAPPAASLTVHGPGLEAAWISGAGLAGTMDVDIDVRGVGASWHALAGSLDGHVGVALVEGEVENALLSRLFGAALRGANLPVEAGGRSHVRCMAVRMDAAGGQMRVGTLALDTTRLRLDGDGGLDLGNETMDMHLRPVIRIGGAGITVPVRVTGPFRGPRAAADKGVLAPGRFGISIAQLGAQLGGALPADPCGPALAAVREGIGTGAR